MNNLKYVLTGIVAFAMTLVIAKAAENQNDSIVCRVFGTVIDRPVTTKAVIIEADKDF